MPSTDKVTTPDSTAAQQQNATPNEPVTLTLAVLGESTASYQALIDAFEEAHPGINVQVESADRLIGDSNNAARALAQAADVFPASYAFGGDWQSLTLDLTPLAEANGLEVDDFPTGSLYAADGTIRHLPYGLDPFLILYNKGIFDDAGLAYPSADWSWEEFVTLATQLTQRYGDFTAVWGWADGLQSYGLVGAALSQPLADYSTTPPTPRLTDEAVVAAIERYLSLFREDGAAWQPGSTDTAYGEAQALIEERRVAMWTVSYNFLDSYSSLDYGVLPLPIMDGNDQRRLYLRSWGFSVSAGTQQPQAAWQLVEYLSRQQGVPEAIPARASVRQATNFWDGVDLQVAEVVESQLANSFELPYSATRQAMGRAIVAGLLLDADVAEALAEEEATARQGLVGEAEPVEMVVTDPDAEPSVTSIVFITDGWHTYRHRALVEAFERENSNIRVNLGWPIFYASGVNVHSMDRSNAGQQADCFLYGPLTTEAEIAKVLPLDALLEIDPDVKHDDFYPVALNAFVHDGALLALPDQFQPPIIGYDTTLFEAANVPYPEAGWTSQQFLEAAVTLTVGEGDDKIYGYVPYQSEARDAWTFLHAFGANLVDRSVEPMTANLNTPVVAEALRWYVALSETYGVKPVYRTNMYDRAGMAVVLELLADRRALFALGHGAMWWSDGSESEGAYPAPTKEIEKRQYTTFPVLPGTKVALPVEASGFYISVEAESDQRQACWKWITFLTEHDAGLGVPARRSVALSDEFHLRVGPAADVMLLSAEQISEQQLVPSPEWMHLMAWYSVALTRVLEESMMPEEALAITQAEFETYHHCVVQRELFAPSNVSERISKCAAPASPLVILEE